MNLFCLILAAICFGIGAIPEAGSKVNWTNAGLAFFTLSLIIPR